MQGSSAIVSHKNENDFDYLLFFSVKKLGDCLPGARC